MSCTGDFLKDFKSLRLIFLCHQIRGIEGLCKGFRHEGQFHAIVVFENFVDGSVIVSKQASFSVWAIEFLVESGASLRLVLGVCGGHLSN